MSGGSPVEVYHSNGAFLLFVREHALSLRRQRILSQPVIGNSTAGPLCLSPYAARMVAQKGMARFKRLVIKQSVSSEANRTNFECKMKDYADEQRELHRVQRLAELRRHNVTPTPETIGKFDERKLRFHIDDLPAPSLAICDTLPVDADDIMKIIDQTCDAKLRHVYDDLYERGFYVSSGMKFGSDFLGYLDDPVRYHAQYAIRLVGGDEAGLVDLTEMDFCEINSLQRLTHTANKIPLLATVTFSQEGAKVSYWSLDERVYLTPESKRTDLERVEPRLSCPARLAAIGNKLARLS